MTGTSALENYNYLQSAKRRVQLLHHESNAANHLTGFNNWLASRPFHSL